ncbi:phage tail protein [Brevibacillus dissolubilis]|uniref:phage tail protein n=1 Tax=Brevibacillus dissolubilis TaxID=1844116 RepID=UPI001116EF09|nr:tail fiber protein [Brevibacillus dissolubilis]
MAESFIGDIQAFAFNYAPRGWAQCNGQILQINQNQALYAILGTKFGGNGVTTFALPDLRGRVPVHTGNGVTLGQSAGEEAHTLTVNEIPAHTHVVSASTAAANQKPAPGNVWTTTAAAKGNVYGTDTSISMGSALTTSGSSQAHPNMQPYTVLNYCICIMGYFPTQN